MNNYLSICFSVISYLPLPSFIKIAIIGFIEAIYNIFINLFSIKFDNNIKKAKKSKLAVITGGTRGVGKQIIKKLLKKNHNIYMFSRSTIEMKKMQKKYGRDRLKFAFLDLSNPKSIKKIVRESIKDSKIDLLINNAGVYYRKIHFKNNVEYNFLVNYLGHYIFVESLKQNIQGRIVNVSSSAMYAATNLAYAKRVDFFMDNYSKSKYANALHAINLREEGFDSVSVHPGIIATDLFNNTQYNIFVSFLKLFLPFALTKVEQAAKNVLNAAFSKEKNENTLFFVNGKKAYGSKYMNIKNALFLKEKTETICEELKINLD